MATRPAALSLALWVVAACATEEAPAPVPEVAPVAPVPIAFSMDVRPAPAPEPEPADSGEEPSREVRLDGEPILVGAMGLAEFVEVVETNRPRLAKCSRQRLPEPKVVVKLTIAKDGEVIGVSLKTSSGSPGVDRCLEKEFREMQFPAHTSGLVVAAVPLDLGAERGPVPAPVEPAPEPTAEGEVEAPEAQAPTPTGSSEPPG